MRDSSPRRSPSGVTRVLCAVAAAALTATACGTDGGAEPADERGELHVFAAASLTDVFDDIAADFEEDHPGVDVVFNFAGSSELAAQINAGAPADVFAAANTSTMDQVVGGEGLDADWAAENGEDGAVFATNTLRIAVPPDNPAGIEDFDDLTGDDVSVALCAEEVPCGAATVTAMEASGVAITPVTYEEDVRAVLTKVELGEVDAGLVYATDVIAAGDRVTGIEFPEADEAVNDYPIGVLANTSDAGLAAEWVELVRSETGAQVLAAAGFGTT
ncbi:molybdate ABC transporter substrate-binding protein [Nocardiopsis sp. CT-R113]|uniref:Molybdate ABC transporter substrate-binding protein n=1 Tax=Nocardiopsis codii TaxID=3065942 RepID=A0ABU7KCE1_9ACTN|nr:molybdate ABC transporter substrate-binding protein [Nocardiopsis sp. CT-R113]MEE2039904.1 molybdate ABC transporter substrate-binding protein [Nocardiopsis sp. CT-R113]